MNYQQIKELCNSEWIIKMCDDLTNPSPFIIKNKVAVLQSLRTAVSNFVDTTIPIHKEFRDALEFLDNNIRLEILKGLA